MSSIDTTKSFEQQIAEASTPTQIREICVNREVAQGTLTQDRDGTVHRVVEPTGASAVPAARAVRADHLQERVIYPHGNSRIVITATSQAELDETEARVRAAFSSQQ